MPAINVRSFSAEIKTRIAPAGRSFLAVSYSYWAKGASVGAAVTNLRKEGGTGDTLIYEVAEGSHMDSCGSISQPAGSSWPVLVFRKKTRGSFPAEAS